MDAEQLAAIRARTDAASKRTDNPDDALAVDLLRITYYCEDVPALLAEVERLRAENAALRELARQVVDMRPHLVSGTAVTVYSDVAGVIAQARALLST